MNVLGIGSYTHDVGAALCVDGKVLFAVEEERLSRQKHHLGIEAAGTPPRRSIEHVLHESGLSLSDIHRFVHVGWEGSDYLKLDFAGLRFREFARELDPSGERTSFVAHHHAHAAGAYYASGFDNALVAAIDGVGDFVSTSLWRGEGAGLRKIDQYLMEDSLGFLYGKAARLLGLGKFGYGEGKMTALAAYGTPLKGFPELVALEDGRYRIVGDYARLFSAYEKRQPGDFTDEQKDFAATVQHVLERTVMAILSRASERNALEQLVLSGGVALNCRMNGRLHALPWVKKMYIQPGANDSGLCIGAAYIGSIELGDSPQQMESAYLGPDIRNEDVDRFVSRNGLNATFLPAPEEFTADVLAHGDTVAWVQGRLEFGPRALGHRSLVGDPRRAEVRDKLNLIKQREPWRPVAPALIRSEKVYCDYELATQHMTKAIEMTPLARAEIPAGIHVDGSARVQLVEDVQDPFFKLIDRFQQVTGIPAVLNTSLNARDEPLCTSIEDAVRFFYTSPTDHLVIGNWLFKKR